MRDVLAQPPRSAFNHLADAPFNEQTPEIRQPDTPTDVLATPVFGPAPDNEAVRLSTADNFSADNLSGAGISLNSPPPSQGAMLPLQSGARLQAEYGISDNAGLLAAVDRDDETFDIDLIAKAEAQRLTNAQIAERGLSPSSRGYNALYSNLFAGYEAQIQSELSGAVARARVEQTQLAESDGGVDGDSDSDQLNEVNFFREMSAAALSAGGNAVAGGIDLVNFAVSAFIEGGEDSGALRSDTLNYASQQLRESSGAHLDRNTSGAVKAEAKRVEDIWATEQSFGRKTVDTIGELANGGGLRFLTYMGAQSAGFLAASLATGGGASLVARSAGGLAARAVPASLARASQNLTAGTLARTTGAQFAVRNGRQAVSLAGGAAFNVGGQTAREADDMFRKIPIEELMTTPGYKRTANALRLELGETPSPAQVRSRMARVIAGTAAGSAAAVTLVGTLVAPFSERALLGIARRGTNNVIPGGRTVRALRAGVLETAAEGSEEFVQSAAADFALAQGVEGLGVADAAAEANTTEAQMAGVLGAILGGTVGVGTGAFAEEGVAATPGDPDTPTGQTESATPADPLAVQPTSTPSGTPVTVDVPSSTPKQIEAAAAAAESGQNADAVSQFLSVAELNVAYGVPVSEDAVIGLEEDHGDAAHPSGSLEAGGDFHTVFSDTGQALAVNVENGALRYGAQNDGTFVWSDTATGDLLRDGADSILTVAALEGNEVNPILARVVDTRTGQAVFENRSASIGVQAQGGATTQDPLAATEVRVSPTVPLEEVPVQVRAFSDIADNFDGVFILDNDDASILGSDVEQYVALTQGRLQLRANEYEATLSSPQLLRNRVDQRLASFQSGLRRTRGVSDMISAVAADPLSDTTRTTLRTQAVDPRRSRAEREAASQLANMIDAKLALDSALWNQRGTARELTAETASQAARSAQAADPLAATTQTRSNAPLFETRSVGELDFVELKMRAVLPDLTASDVNQLAYIIANEPDFDHRPTEGSVRGTMTLSPLGNMASSEAGQIAHLERQAAISGVVPTEETQVIPEGELASAQLQQAVGSMALRTEDGSPAGETISEAAKGFNVTPSDIAEHVEQAARMGAVEGKATKDFARQRQEQLTRNSLSAQVVENPVENLPLQNLAARMSQQHANKGVRFEVHESMDAYEQATGDSVGRGPIMGANAFYIRDTTNKGARHRIVLIRDRIPDIETARKLIAHEFVAHYGVRKLLGETGIQMVAHSILNSNDKPVKNLVRQVRRDLIAARVANTTAEIKAFDGIVPDNLKEAIAADVDAETFRGELGEEVLARAVELGFGADNPKRSIAQGVIEQFRGLFTEQSAVDVSTAQEMADLLRTAREVTLDGGSPRLNPHNQKRTVSTRSEFYGLSTWQRMSDYLFNAEAPLMRIGRDASLQNLQDENGNDIGQQFQNLVQTAPGLQTTRAGEISAQHMTRLGRQFSEARKRAKNFTPEAFETNFNQWLYLQHAEERIQMMHYMGADLETRAAREERADIIRLARGLPVDAPAVQFADLRQRLLSIQDPALDPVRNRDPNFGKSIVGRTYAEIDEDRTQLQKNGFDAIMQEIDFFGETGSIRQVTEAVLENRMNGAYGTGGHNLTRLYGYTRYVPMAEYDGSAQGGAVDLFRAQRLRGNRTNLAVAAEGREQAPTVPIMSQLDRLIKRSSAETVTNNVRRSLLGITTTADENGHTVREEFEGLVDVIASNVPYEDIAPQMSAFSRDPDTFVTWMSDGSATVIRVKDTNVVNALREREVRDTPRDIVQVGKETFARATRGYGRLLTSYNPVFVYAAQLPRDLGQALTQAGFEQRLGFGRTMAVGANAIRMQAPMIRFFSANAEERSRLLREEYSQPDHPMHGFYQRTQRGGVPFFEQQFNDPSADNFVAPGSVRAAANRTNDLIQSMSNSADNAVRQALFDQVVAAQLARPEGERPTIEGAYEIANEVAVNMLNFSQRSRFGQALGMIHPFAQTALNGADTIIQRRLWNDGRIPIEQERLPDGTVRQRLRDGWYNDLNKPLAGALAIVGLSSAYAGLSALQLANFEDDDDGARRAALRPITFMRNYMIPSTESVDGNEVPFSVPVQPGHMGFIHALAQVPLLLNAGYSREEVGAALTSSAVYNLTPFSAGLGQDLEIEDLLHNVIPTLFQPLLQVDANENAFGGSIFSDANRDGDADGALLLRPRLSLPQQYVSMAEELQLLSRDIGFEVEISPEVLRHLSRSYLGGIGSNMDKALRMMQEAEIEGDTVFTAQNLARLTNSVPRDPEYVDARAYFTTVNKVFDPIITQFETAQELDAREGHERQDIDGKGHGPRASHVMEVYGRKTILGLNEVIGRTRKESGQLKAQLTIARSDKGSPEEVREIYNRSSEVYREGYIAMRDLLDAAGISGPASLDLRP